MPSWFYIIHLSVNDNNYEDNIVDYYKLKASTKSKSCSLNYGLNFKVVYQNTKQKSHWPQVAHLTCSTEL